MVATIIKEIGKDLDGGVVGIGGVATCDGTLRLQSAHLSLVS